MLTKGKFSFNVAIRVSYQSMLPLEPVILNVAKEQVITQTCQRASYNSKLSITSYDLILPELNQLLLNVAFAEPVIFNVSRIEPL